MMDDPIPELSRPVPVSDLARGSKTVDIKATESECSALALRFGLLTVDRLEASARLVPQPGSVVRLDGRIEAEVTQSCVVTLEPVSSSISASFERLYSQAWSSLDRQDEEVSLEGDDLPDPILDGVVDVGEAVAEQLGLEIDPFPRAPGVEFEGYSDGEAAPSPFDVLARLKRE